MTTHRVQARWLDPIEYAWLHVNMTPLPLVIAKENRIPPVPHKPMTKALIFGSACPRKHAD